MPCPIAVHRNIAGGMLTLGQAGWYNGSCSFADLISRRAVVEFADALTGRIAGAGSSTFVLPPFRVLLELAGRRGEPDREPARDERGVELRLGAMPVLMRTAYRIAQQSLSFRDAGQTVRLRTSTSDTSARLAPIGIPPSKQLTNQRAPSNPVKFSLAVSETESVAVQLQSACVSVSA